MPEGVDAPAAPDAPVADAFASGFGLPTAHTDAPELPGTEADKPVGGVMGFMPSIGDAMKGASAGDFGGEGEPDPSAGFTQPLVDVSGPSSKLPEIGEFAPLVDATVGMPLASDPLKLPEVPAQDGSMPSIGGAASLPSVTAPGVDASLSEVSGVLPTVDTSLPTVDASLPAVDASANLPGVDASLPEASATLPTADLSGLSPSVLDASLPDANAPRVTLPGMDAPELDAQVPGEVASDVKLPGVSVGDVSAPSLGSIDPGAGLTAPTMPGEDISAPSATLDGALPGVSAPDMPSVDVTAPAVDMPSAPAVDASLPDASLEKPGMSSGASLAAGAAAATAAAAGVGAVAASALPSAPGVGTPDATPGKAKKSKLPSISGFFKRKGSKKSLVEEGSTSGTVPCLSAPLLSEHSVHVECATWPQSCK